MENIAEKFHKMVTEVVSRAAFQMPNGGQRVLIVTPEEVATRILLGLLIEEMIVHPMTDKEKKQVRTLGNAET